jgi:hypothetical protein
LARSTLDGRGLRVSGYRVGNSDEHDIEQDKCVVTLTFTSADGQNERVVEVLSPLPVEAPPLDQVAAIAKRIWREKGSPSNARIRVEIWKTIRKSEGGEFVVEDGVLQQVHAYPRQ